MRRARIIQLSFLTFQRQISLDRLDTKVLQTRVEFNLFDNLKDIGYVSRYAILMAVEMVLVITS
jgi:hypothetical protein